MPHLRYGLHREDNEGTCETRLLYLDEGSGVLDRPLVGVREEAWKSAQGMKIDPGVVVHALPAPL